ncbi:S9 family peptidase [Alkalimonas collagenimarina]|uniref:S9 family peptidase n=1 Tax=Alkalimonas collagenimarina TaxID=400390 RepID=A0ABT9GYL8_9GAMM|nr:S9 family peptidase [Alkalimonas collagenimarina]MDP4536113.1 S9 family peptidase [Alkalimonas collagenimarina]
MLMRLFACTMLLCCSVSFAETRGMQPEDYYQFVFVADPQLAPDGRSVAFVHSTIDDDKRTRHSNLWLVATDGKSQPRQLSFSNGDRSPRWSPDGRQLAFISGRGEGQQLYLLPMAGGEARALTELKQAGIRDFSWSPDGKQLLLTLSVDPDVTDPTKEKTKSDEAEADVVVIRHALYKSDGSGYLNERRSGLWLLDIDTKQLTQLTGDARWHDHSAQFSPDGKQIVFASDRSSNALEGSMQQDLYLYQLSDGSTTRLDTLSGQASSPQWSPDGRQLLYQYQADYFEPQQLIVHQLRDGSNKPVARDWDRNASSMHWLTNERILLGADHLGARPLFELDVRRDNSRIRLSEQGSASNVTVADNGKRLSYLWQDEQNLPEIWYQDGNKAPQQLTQFNQGLLAGLTLQPLQSFWFEHEQGRSQGFLLKPVGWQAGQSYPLVLNIKGGPGGMWGHQWFHEFQMMAAAGYAVVFTNYRGSTGYGFAHQNSVHADYGGVDYRDNIAVLDHVLQQHNWLDTSRLYITGGSHGGFLTNWITSQTDRFKAAVTQRSVSNWISEAGTQQYPPNSMRREFAGTIWQNFDLYWNRSPLKYANQVSTPTLIIHSTDDHITPIGQGEEWFYALKANEVPTEMVVFKGESHSLSRSGTPVNLVERLKRILEWFERHSD